jgi:hypothetical protein
VTKKQIVWLLIRLAGLWFLFQAVTGLVTLITTYFHTSQDERLLEKSTWLFLQQAGQIFLSFAIGLYCAGDGRILFELLNRENPFSGYIDDDESDSSRSSSSPGSTLGLP